MDRLLELPRPGSGARRLKLSALDKRLLELASEGKHYPEMVPEIGRGQQTVKNRAFRILHRLDARTVTQAVAIALREGIIQ